MSMRHAFALLTGACLLAGCTSVEVQPVTAAPSGLKVVYIQRNQAADDIAPDLESAIENSLQRHGIGTKIVSQEPSDADYSLTYAATSGWDLKPFVKTAEVRLKRGARQVGYVRYENSGGFNVSKYASAREKMDPLLDRLLAGSR